MFPLILVNQSVILYTCRSYVLNPSTLAMRTVYMTNPTACALCTISLSLDCSIVLFLATPITLALSLLLCNCLCLFLYRQVICLWIISFVFIVRSLAIDRIARFSL